VKVVQETEQVEEERVTAEAGKELDTGAVDPAADDRVRTEADRSRLDQR
jgi:hypothetical protein